MKIVDLEYELIPLKIKLQEHKIYKSIKNIKDIRLFMEHHVFAVWDFMSLLKQLQNQLSCTKVPWLPSRNPEATRLINEIVWGEESDLNRKGIPMSHFEMYLDAMTQVNGNTFEIDNFIKSGDSLQKLNQLEDAKSNYEKALSLDNMNPIIKNKIKEVSGKMAYNDKLANYKKKFDEAKKNEIDYSDKLAGQIRKETVPHLSLKCSLRKTRSKVGNVFFNFLHCRFSHST